MCAEMKIGSETQSAPLRNRETRQRAVSLLEIRRRKERESCCPRSYSLPFMPRRRSRLQQSRILFFELPQFLGSQKSQGIGNGQYLAVQNRQAAIPGAFFSAEGLGQRQERTHLGHFFNSVHQYGNGRTAQDQHRGWPRQRQVEMLVAAYNVVRPCVALHDMANFPQNGAIQIHNRSAQTVRAPNFLN